MQQGKRSFAGIRRLIEFLAFVGGSMLVIFTLSSIALLVYTNGVAAPRTVTIEIPVGSAARIDVGENPLDIPPVWIFSAGDELVLDNADTVPHHFGDRTVAPGESITLEIGVTTGGGYSTSLHPRGMVTLEVEPSRFDFSIIAFSTFAFGTAVGVMLFVSVSIMRAMGKEDEGDWTDA